MRPSEVRSRIALEHEELRGRLAQLEAHVSALAEGIRAALPLVLAHTSELSARLLEHVDLEDRLLAPALRVADAWGEQRERELLTHHREQRRQIGDLLDALQSLSQGRQDPSAIVSLVRTVRGFAAELELDMQHEDAALLNSDLLRDDVVAIGAEDG